MDISSPITLWRDYDVTALPLNETELSSKTVGEHRVREYYYDGFTTTGGKVRAFIRIYESPSDKGVILYMSDRHGGATADATAEAMLARGYTVAVLDYLGKSDADPRYSLYPAALDYCNCRGETVFPPTADALKSRWYIWACMARRALILLRRLYAEKKIFALGSEIGGATVYKLAAFDDGPLACATLLNVLPDIEGEASETINYRAALDNYSYAPLLEKPIIMAVCSNSEDGSLDKMSDLAQTTATLRAFRIVKRAADDGIKVVYNQIDRFFTAYAMGINPHYPSCKIKPVNSENKLYFNITVDADSEGYNAVRRVNMYAAFCIKNPTTRNWTNMHPLGIGGGEYIAHFDILQNDMPVYSFINIIDESGNVFSSPITTIVPKTMGIPAQPVVKSRLIYDGGMGADVWMAPGGGDVLTSSGPFGITGVTSEKNSLVTYKPGDLLYQAEPDSLLQVIVSGKCETLEITASDGTEKYSCKIALASADEWCKFTLSGNDFKSANGVLADWTKIVQLNFSADNEFLISSVLWV